MKRSPFLFITVPLLLCRVGMAQTGGVLPGQLPTGGVVSGGTASIQSSGATMSVNQTSSRAVVDWNTFNIGSQAKVNFNQPSASAVILNRVMDANPSQILGQLSATGQVFVSNPNGIIFGTSSRVDVGGLVATTQQIGLSDFMVGRQRFDAGANAGSVVNQGVLQTALGGYIALLAPQVRNEGVIVAREGTVALAAGAQTTLEFTGTRLVSVIVTQPVLNALIENQQLIRAEGGYVVMAARSASTLMRAVINNSGSVEVPSLVERQGRILLEGGDNGVVQIGGRLLASGSEPGSVGGRIVATGDKVLVTSDARLEVTGPAGGGSILVGGGWQGQDAAIRNANAVVVQSGARLDASATDQGNGGEVVVFSNTQQAGGVTRVAGELLARGGPQGGDGGRIETSGHWLSTNGATGDARAPAGQAGQWLFDPYNVTITSGATQNNTESSGTWTPSNSPSEIQNSAIATLLNAGTHVTVSTGGTGSAGGDAGNIVVNAPIAQSATAPAARLTLSAQQDITVNQSITMPNSGSRLELISGNTGSGGNVALNAAVNVDTVSMAMTGPNSTVTQTAALTTNNLRISGTQTDVTLGHAANNIGVVAANVKSLVLQSNEGIDQGSVYGKGTYVGAVDGLSGVTASGVIHMTSNGNLFLTQNLTSGSTGLDAVQLNAGASLSPGAYTGADSATNPYGPNVILTSGKTITTGAGGRATVYMGSTTGSGTALASYITGASPAGSPRFRYNSDETTTNYTALSGTDTGLFAILRQNPVLTVTANNASTVYGATLTPSTSVSVSGYLNGDTLAQAVATGATNSIAGPTSTAGYLTAGAHALTPHGAAGNLGYDFRYVDGALTVSPKTLTIAAAVTGGGKVYDGSTVASTSLTTADRVGADVVTLGSSASNYNIKNVGAGKSVTVSGLSIAGTDAANYSLASTTATTTGSITKKDLTASFTASNKTYDGAVTASVQGASTDIVSGDAVSVSGSGTFDTKNVGTGKTVSIGTISLAGVDAGNYNLLTTSSSATAAITAKSITPVYAASNKAYDGTTTATVNASTSGFVAGDVVSLTNTGANFADKNVGVGKAVTIGGIALSGAGMGNYSLASTSATASANITAIPLTVSGITAADKIYDGNTSATVNTSAALFTGLLAGDVVGVTSSGTFSNKNVQSNKTVALSSSYSGADVGNYTITPQANTTASITARSLAVSATVSNKTYDSTRTASYALNSDQVIGDALTLSATSALFDDKNAGTGKSVTLGGISLTGGDAGNYTLQNSSTTARADITPKAITASGITAANKVYDATDAATLQGAGATLTSGGVTASDKKIYAGDTVQVNTAGAVGVFAAGKNVGAAKDVTISGLTLTGTEAANYTVTDASAAKASITPAPLAISGITATDRVYDGSTAASVSTAGVVKTGLLGTDTFTVSASGQFVDKNAGVNKTVPLVSTYGGSDAGNYAITSQPSATATITPRDLLVTTTASNKVYDATPQASYALSANPLSGDTLALNATSGLFADKNVGTGKAVTVAGITVSGADAGNYNLLNTQATSTANITPKSITASGVVATAKVYDTTDLAQLNVATASLTSGGASASDNKVYAGDDVRLDTTSALGTFSAGKQVGVNKTVAVSGLALSGLDAGNYRVTDASGAVASITAKDVTVSGITAANKVYDATSVATLNVTGAALSAGAASASDNKVYASDDVRLNASGATGSFAAGKNVGTAQAVTVSGLTLSGTDAGNYRVTDASGAVASITAKDVTTQGILALSRAYDGSDVASLNLNGLMLVSGASSATDNRVYAGDQVSVNTTAVTGAFTGGKNVGTGKAVAINGLALNGADAGNYRVSDASGAAASITPKSLVMTGTSVDNKTYDATTAANVQMGTLNGLVGVETVTVTALGAFDARQAGPRSAQVSYTLADGANGGLASNYSLPDAVGLTAVIAPKPVTVTGIIASHKVYDATSTASLNTSGATLTTGAAQASDNKVYASDDVGVNVSGASGVFVAGKNVGVGKAVSVSGLALSGADAANYRVSDASGATANITPKAVTSQGITAANKVYDATQVATLDVRGAALMTGASTAQDNKVYASDDVRLQTSGATGIFAAGKNVGVSKAVSVSGLTLSGADAANYLVTDASGATASITAKAVTASGITALNKVYDANDVASLNVSGVTLTPGAAAASDNKVYASDDVRVSTAAVAGVLVDGKNVGTGKPVAISGLTLSGADASNYTVSDASGATANVSPKWVDATGVTASGKYFDGTSNASLNTQGAVITGGATHANDGKYYSADNVRLNTAASSGVFAAGALPGVGKAVNVQGLALTGADAGNYRVVDASNAQASIKLWEGLSSCSIGAGCAVASPMRVSMVAPQVSKQPVQALAYQSAAASSVGSVPAMLATLSPDNPVNLPLVRSLSVQDVASLSTRQLAQAMPYLSASQWMALSPAQMEGLSDAQRALALQRQDVARQVLPLSAAQIMSLPVDGVATYLRLFSQTQLQSLTSAQLQSLSPSQQAERAAMLQALSR